jgi:lipid II:glycine glycyltransferase (peptidoglycan interpeptide bridge formation enzyme)
MFTTCNQFMQYHLSGTDDDYLRFTPMKLLLDEARLIGNELKLKKFNLGGGYSGGNDSLFEFKASFSKNIALFKVWSHIINHKAYNDLAQAKFGNEFPEVNFFPLYRYA